MACRDDLPPQIRMLTYRRNTLTAMMRASSTAMCQRSARPVPEVSPWVEAHQEEQARPDHETGGQAKPQHDLRNVRPEMEGNRLAGAHADHQQQQRQPALRGFALGPPPQERGHADAIEGAEHGEEEQEILLNMIGASGQPDFRKVVAARRQMMHVQDDQGAQLYPRKTAAPVILPP